MLRITMLLLALVGSAFAEGLDDEPYDLDVPSEWTFNPQGLSPSTMRAEGYHWEKGSEARAVSATRAMPFPEYTKKRKQPKFYLEAARHFARPLEDVGFVLKKATPIRGAMPGLTALLVKPDKTEVRLRAFFREDDTVVAMVRVYPGASQETRREAAGVLASFRLRGR